MSSNSITTKTSQNQILSLDIEQQEGFQAVRSVDGHKMECVVDNINEIENLKAVTTTSNDDRRTWFARMPEKAVRIVG